MDDLQPFHVNTHELGLSLVVGKAIREVRGYVSKPFGPEPRFKLTRIEFEDGSFVSVEGEHDYPYITSYGQTTQPGIDDETLERLYEGGA